MADSTENSWVGTVAASITNALKASADETVKENAAFASESGLSAKIVRKTSGGTCAWCRDKAGTYDYGSEPSDVYRRHDNCDCTVEYVVGKDRQNVHTKTWTRSEEADKIEERKQTGQSGGVKITPKQFGRKAGKHASDFGLDPSKGNERKEFEAIINSIVDSPDEIRRGSWRGQYGLCDFYIKGADVVIVNNGNFVSVLKDGINNARVKNARKQ